jgi:hypothetical protein
MPYLSFICSYDNVVDILSDIHKMIAINTIEMLHVEGTQVFVLMRFDTCFTQVNASSLRQWFTTNYPQISQSLHIK